MTSSADSPAETPGKTGNPPAGATAPSLAKKPRSPAIQVSTAVLDSARQSAEELLQSLQTSPGGLTQREAESRARKTGPNEVAQEKRQRWPGRLLKILLNPPVVLLATFSAISFGTGGARAGTLMTG